MSICAFITVIVHAQDLPGVGWKLRRRLNEENMNICSDLWPLPVARLQKGFGLGEKTGQALWEACRGIDNRPVQVSKPWYSMLCLIYFFSYSISAMYLFL